MGHLPPPPADPSPADPDLRTQLRLACDLAHLAVWRRDLRSGRLDYCAEALRILDLNPRPGGLSAEEVADLVHPDDLPEQLAADERALAGRDPVDTRARYRRPDGSWRHVLTRRVAQRNELGEAVALLGVVFDQTELAEASDHAHRVRRELRQAAEAAEAAELRAALVARAVGMGTWMVDLTTGHATWDDQMWCLRGLSPQPVPLTRDERLALVHPDDQPRLRELYDDADDVTKANDDGRPTAIEFRVVHPDGSWHWLGSRSAAVRDAQGRLLRRIGVNWDITDAHEAARLRQESRLAQLEREAQSRLLARMSHELRTPLNAVLGFSQLLEADPGLGAAARAQLAQVLAAGRQLVALVDNVLLQAGTPALAVPPPRTAPRPVLPNPHRVLYIEDNEVNALIVTELLGQRRDIAVEVAPDGRRGVQRALELQPALVLVDMQLPDFNGTEVLRRLRADPRGAALRCVALSANAMPEDVRAAREAGFADYWTKPLDFQRFGAAIDALLGPAPA